MIHLKKGTVLESSLSGLRIKTLKDYWYYPENDYNHFNSEYIHGEVIKESNCDVDMGYNLGYISKNWRGDVLFLVDDYRTNNSNFHLKRK